MLKLPDGTFVPWKKPNPYHFLPNMDSKLLRYNYINTMAWAMNQMSKYSNIDQEHNQK